MASKNRWVGPAFAGLTALYILPATGIFNDIKIGALAFNLVFLVVILLAFVCLAVAWFSSSSTKQDLQTLQQEVDHEFD